MSFSLKRMHAVVVDDEQNMMQLLAQMLARLGVGRVETFGDPKRALEAVRLMPPHLMLIDWKMAPINGTELVRQIRGMGPTGEDIGLFMVTGHADINRVRSALTAGVDDFIVKPVAAQNLRMRISRFIDLRPDLKWQFRDTTLAKAAGMDIPPEDPGVQLSNDEIAALFD